MKARTIGIVAHSFEGGALCFLTACREGMARLGPHMHPEVVVSAIPMGLSLPGWEADDRAAVAEHLARGVAQVAAAGADFYVCPDNTAHMVLEEIAAGLPLPGLHIAQVVCDEMRARGWRRAGLLGTRWTMDGPVYPRMLDERGLGWLVPGPAMLESLNTAIFAELCQGIFREETTGLFLRAISDLRDDGADCVILGCTEIPLVVTEDSSPLPVLDSTRLLARAAVDRALDPAPMPAGGGWLD